MVVFNVGVRHTSGTKLDLPSWRVPFRHQQRPRAWRRRRATQSDGRIRNSRLKDETSVKNRKIRDQVDVAILFSARTPDI